MIPLLLGAAAVLWYVNRAVPAATNSVVAFGSSPALPPAPASAVALVGLPTPAVTSTPVNPLVRKLPVGAPIENFWTIDAGDDSSPQLTNPPVPAVGAINSSGFHNNVRFRVGGPFVSSAVGVPGGAGGVDFGGSVGTGGGAGGGSRAAYGITK